jgi:hypothetical protein
MNLNISNLDSIYKSDAFIEQPRIKAPLLERHVEWLGKSDRSLIKKIAVVALVILEVIALTATVVGLLIVFKAILIHIKLEKVKTFYCDAKAKEPPPKIPSHLYEKTLTFNHLNTYALHDGIIWYRRNASHDGKWKPLYFDGYPHRTPCEIQADGCNLIVTDDKNVVHYKKVIEEARDPHTKEYCFIDVSEENNWLGMWFSVPIIHHFANILWGKKLDLSGVRGWGISHRGTYNHYFEDGLSKKCYAPVGTTSLYALAGDGRSIKVFDPWCPPIANITLPLPMSSDTDFEGISISASSSTVMVIGYEHKKGSDEKQLKVYTWLVDIDTLGWNPGHAFDYPCNDPEIKPAISHEKWTEHTIPGNVSKNIRIIQTGEGNRARIMMMEGVDDDGRAGYYWKEIEASTWNFEARNIPMSPLLENSTPCGETLITPPVSDYTGKIRHGSSEVEGVAVELKGFGGGQYLSELIITDAKNHRSTLYLNKRKTIKNFLGFKKHVYEIVYPSDRDNGIEIKMSDLLKKLFSGKKVIEVTVYEKQKKLYINAGKTRIVLQTEPALSRSRPETSVKRTEQPISIPTIVAA